MAAGGAYESGAVPLFTEAENRRQVGRARLLNPGTRWLLERAGVGPGMAVLDVGTGAGDVAFLAAELVGERGRVVGVDLNPAILEMARARAEAAGLRHVSFAEGNIREGLALDVEIDAIVGRSVLMHLEDPAGVLRRLTRSLRPGGVAAFREEHQPSDIYRAYPPSPLLAELERLTLSVRERMDPPWTGASMGMELYRVLLDAGLTEPQAHLDAPMGGGPDWPGYEYIAETLRLAAGVAVKLGVEVPHELDPDTFAARLREETMRQRGVLRLMNAVGAWARKP
jgi:ubiquinone/menaquinone biosynthesis C-methylase UbiE